MAITSLFSGLALANAGLGAVHGLAGPLGGLIGAPHGEICAALLPHVMRVNLREIRRLDAGAKVLERYEVLARILTGRDSVEAEDAIGWLQDLSRDFQIRSLSELGLEDSELRLAAEKACNASSMKSNPVILSSENLVEIMEDAL
jgi:alcohol dehydrogenase class IV